MFAVLNYIEPACGYFERRKQKVYLRKCEPAVIRTPDGLPYFIVDVLLDKKGVDWEALHRRLGKCAVRVIATRDIALPDTFTRYTPKRLIPSMVFNTAVCLLSESGISPQGLSVTLTDSGALLCDRALSLLPFASTVKIVTRFPEKYELCAREAMERFGASIIVTDCLDASANDGVIICADNCMPPAVNAACVISFSRCPRGCLSVTGNGIELDDYYLRTLPDGIDLLDFAGALVELCGVGSLLGACFKSLSVNGSRLSYSEAAKLVANALVCANT